MDIICDKTICTGCGACVNRCPVSCIALEEDSEGFFAPVIDQTRCVDCQKCQRVCPALHSGLAKNSPLGVFKAYSKDAEILKRSTSGGIFSELALRVLKKGGTVAGAILDESFHVSHIMVSHEKELAGLCGSKYIGSNPGLIYQQVKALADEGKPVLFSGTPCQVAGLNQFLGKPYENVVTCDFICHGVGSARVFRKYIAFLEKKSKDTARNVLFRNKKSTYINSQFTVFFDKKEVSTYYAENPFAYGFSSGKINRMSCSSCQYAKIERTSDITLADLIHELSLKEKKQGASLVLVNSAKGKALFLECDLYKEEKDLAFALRYQPHLSGPQPFKPEREKLFEELEEQEFGDIITKYLTFAGNAPVRTALRGVKRLLK